MRVRITIRTTRRESEPDCFLFSNSFLETRRRWRGLIISLVGHCMLVPMVPTLSSLTWSLTHQEVSWKSYSVQPLRVALPEPLYFSDKKPVRPAKVNKPIRPQRRPVRQVRKIRLAAAKPAPGPQIRKPALELPKLPFSSSSLPVVLQPEIQPLAATAETKLARILSWTRQTPQIPRPRPKAFVIPGRNNAAVNGLNAHPVLEVPNLELNPSDINIAASVPVSSPALPRPPSTTTPVRVFQPPQEEQRTGSMDVFSGAPANVVVLSEETDLNNSNFVIPPGSNVPPLPPAPQAADSQGATVTITGGDGGNGGSTASGTGSQGNGNGTISLAGAVGYASSGSSGGNGGNGSGVSSPSAPPGDAGAIRVVHPVPQAFDVVIVNSSPDDTFSTGAGALTGKPVYTVYLHVGAQRDWPLQFCLPRIASTSRRDDMVVQVGTGDTLQPPAPTMTVVPREIRQPRTSYTLVHGFLNTSGRFRNLSLVGKPDAQLRTLLQFLEKWEFQPAMQNGKPIEVEILLAIPPHN